MYGTTLLRLTDAGLYCEQGDFYIDPWKPVKNAIITHAHSDHARAGHESYLCHRLTAPLLQLRLGPVSVETLGWNETRTVNGVKISLHPAGHIIGSAQIRVEYKGEIWVASGDYKPEADQLSGRFEPVRCHTFITESTFGLPIYQWQEQSQVFESMKSWIRKNQSEGYHSLLLAYSLGKAQRVLKGLETTDLPFFAHGAVANVQETLAPLIPSLTRVQRIENREQLTKGNPGIIIAPPTVLGSAWCNRLKPFRSAMISGWMQVRGNQRRSGTDTGFVLSDHADWKGLLESISATGASRVWVTHGFTAVLSRYLKEKGLEAAILPTSFGTEEEETLPESTTSSDTISVQ